MEKIEAEHWK